METWFSVSFLLVAPFWLLMVLFPRAAITARIISSPWIVGGAGLAYSILVIPRMAVLVPTLANPSLAEIAPLLGTEEGAALAWLHFLAFDAFVARWIYLDGAELGLSSWAISPVLLVVLMFGPLGLLIYLAYRELHRIRVAGVSAR